MLNFLRRRWFLVAILLCIPLGMALGLRANPSTVSHFPKHLVQIFAGLMQAVILFLMSVTLESSRLRESLRSPVAVLWGASINFVLIPAAAMALLPLQRQADFTVGLMVAAAVPTTLAASSVWTRKAGGNDAISLLIMILTNGLCFLVTPLWLKISLSHSVELNVEEMIGQLFLTALLPILLGQAFRASAWFRNFADRAKEQIGAVAQFFILLIVFWASVQSGVKVMAGRTGSAGFPAGPALIVWGCCIALHLTSLFIALQGGRLLRLTRDDTVGAALAASQKTLPVGLFVAAMLARNGTPLVMLPMLMFHASQLVIDTLLIDTLQRWIAADPANGEVAAPSSEQCGS
jgi:sodium/bile acid cotransporter 7